MTQDEYNRYWRPAREMVFKHYPYIKSSEDWNHDYKASVKLAGLLGYWYPSNAYWDVIDLTPKLRRSLEMIAGPYGHTVIRVLEIQHADQKRDHSGAANSEA